VTDREEYTCPRLQAKAKIRLDEASLPCADPVKRGARLEPLFPDPSDILSCCYCNFLLRTLSSLAAATPCRQTHVPAPCTTLAGADVDSGGSTVSALYFPIINRLIGAFGQFG
jgi:hypothetical protein